MIKELFQTEKDTYQKTQLSNGLRVITETHKETIASSLGLFVRFGTRYEPVGLAGAAHFIEHMVFKGTEKRSAFELAKALEELGGELNAHTSREHTCYTASCLATDLAVAVEILADIALNATFLKSDFDSEREVILHEISMVDDQLEEWVFDELFLRTFEDQPLAAPILGTEKSLEAISRDNLYNLYKQIYSPENLILCVAGPADHEEVCALGEKLFVAQEKKSDPIVFKLNESSSLKQKSICVDLKKESECTHILWNSPSCSIKEEDRFATYILSCYLGGGMTSKLYQVIREEKGLAYSVYSYLQNFFDTGTLSVYVGTSEKHQDEVAELLKSEIEVLYKNGLDEKTFESFKKQILGQTLLGSEDLDSRMQSLGLNEMIFGKNRSLEDIYKDIQGVRYDAFNKVVKKYLNPLEASLIRVGSGLVDRDYMK